MAGAKLAAGAEVVRLRVAGKNFSVPANTLFRDYLEEERSDACLELA
ncbi:MAG: hypothetical protein G01um101417_623, partial [Parcubacteria group bacterium Gr01-1014_17]